MRLEGQICRCCSRSRPGQNELRRRRARFSPVLQVCGACPLPCSHHLNSKHLNKREAEWRRCDKDMEPQWGGEKSLTAAEKDHTLTDRVCAYKTSWAECRDRKRRRHRANGGDFSLDIHSYRTILRSAIWSLLSSTSTPSSGCSRRVERLVES